MDKNCGGALTTARAVDIHPYEIVVKKVNAQMASTLYVTGKCPQLWPKIKSGEITQKDINFLEIAMIFAQNCDNFHKAGD